MPSPSKPRARLSEAQVLTIFQARASASTATQVATVYGVSEKAVRDIWKGRTWPRETWHLDTSRPLQLKLTGRPKGCRDSKPRIKRVDRRHELTGSTAQAPGCWPHSDMHGAAGLAFEQDTLYMPLDHCEKQMAGLTQSAESGACFQDSSAAHRAVARRITSTTPPASLDEQLHEWDEFWLSSTCADPFCGDWEPL